jgi:diguanylate cyclase (GGDEF)-like protein/PAS domain S-box-containing protein
MKDSLFIELQESELRYRRLFEAAQDGILILDAETGMIEDVNPFLIKMLGYSRDEFIKRKLWEVGAFKDVKASKNAFVALQNDEYIRYKDLPLKAKDGKLFQVEFVSNVYLVRNKKVIQCNIRDITDRTKAQNALIKSKLLFREQSLRDHLTGLYNRRYLEETLNREILRAFRKHLSLGVTMLDIDNFKQYNDTKGHAAGDTMLQELSKVMLNKIREEDIACRYGGDEFIIVLPEASREVILDRATSICEFQKQVKIESNGEIIQVPTVSLGIAVFPEDGTTSDEILKAADHALFQAKHQGGGQVAQLNSALPPGNVYSISK